jgi:ubiquinone/menaquinone biosynthesis C-methylase UbiE
MNASPASYDACAELYDRAFDDITVRNDEWRFITARLPTHPRPRVLDVGCGNGALLSALAPRMREGIGIDVSHAMLKHAVVRNHAQAHLSFRHIEGLQFPAADRSVDVVISLLSFRYLDWNTALQEMRRVLAPGGRLLIVDMAAQRLTPHELPRYAAAKAQQLWLHRRRPEFATALRTLVTSDAFGQMLRAHPIRQASAMRACLQQHFPSRSIETLNVGTSARMLAFDSGPLP